VPSFAVCGGHGGALEVVRRDISANGDGLNPKMKFYLSWSDSNTLHCALPHVEDCFRLSSAPVLSILAAGSWNFVSLGSLSLTLFCRFTSVAMS